MSDTQAKVPTFKGRVFLHPSYVKLQNENPKLKTYTTEFKTYWQLGFSPLIGKDGILSVPDIYADNAIGRVHVEPPVKDPKTYSSTEACWLIWATSESPHAVPTSNTFLIYCVADTRDCCLLSYLDQSSSPSHDIICDEDFRKNMRNAAEEFFRNKGIFALEREEHDSIFSEKWLNEKS